jgi:GT2 family glycosyltransferase
MIRFTPRDEPVASVIVVAWREAPLLLPCLESVADKVGDSVPYEVRIVLNEPSQTLSTQVSREVSGAQVMRFRSNLGFGGAVNYAAERAPGDYLVLLNDDCVVEQGWLETLVDTVERRARCGLVGSTFLHPDGSLQEAGSILWSDGTTSAAGDGHTARSFRFERKVDYCSGGSLLIRKDVWDELGGFDDRYYPAYFEDLDLTLRAGEMGWEAWYQPLSVVRHTRSSSSGRLHRFLYERSGAVFHERWGSRLGDQPRKGEYEEAVWQAMGRPLRVLVIDDHLPDPSMGAGFGRMYDTLEVLSRDAQTHVDLYPALGGKNPSNALINMGVRIIDNLAGHLATDGVNYEVVIISRPNNFDDFGEMIRRRLPNAHLIYDAESLFYRRFETLSDIETLSATALGLEDSASIEEAAAEMRALEESIFVAADTVVCISEVEAEQVRRCTTAAVCVVEPWLSLPKPTDADYDERRHIGLVAGWAAGPGSPNCDGLLWFAHEVLPKVRASLPGLRLLVTGANPPSDVNWLDGHGVDFVGHVNELRDFYNQIRVAISPTRFGAGVKLKTVEAIQYGVPVVATGEATGGLSPSLLDAVWITDDPSCFAQAIIELASDRATWDRYRQAELDQCSARAMIRPDGERWLDVIRETLRHPHERRRPRD